MPSVRQEYMAFKSIKKKKNGRLRSARRTPVGSRSGVPIITLTQNRGGGGNSTAIHTSISIKYLCKLRTAVRPPITTIVIKNLTAKHYYT